MPNWSESVTQPIPATGYPREKPPLKSLALIFLNLTFNTQYFKIKFKPIFMDLFQVFSVGLSLECRGFNELTSVEGGNVGKRNATVAAS